MTAVEQAAQKIANTMVGNKVDKQVAFDPAVILVIIQIIQDILTVYQDCNVTPPAALAQWKEFGLITRWRLRRIIKKNVDDSEVYETIGLQIFNAMKSYSSTATEDDAKALFAEV